MDSIHREAVTAIGAFAIVFGGIAAIVGIGIHRRWRRISPEQRETQLEIPDLPRTARAAAAELQRLPPQLVIEPYDPIANTVVQVLVVAFGGAWLFYEDAIDRVILGTAAVVAAVYFVIDIHRIRAGKPCLVITRDGFELRTLLRTRSFRWSEVDGVFDEVPFGHDGFIFNLLARREKRKHQWVRDMYDVRISANLARPFAEIVDLLNRRLVLWRIAHGMQPNEAIRIGAVIDT